MVDNPPFKTNHKSVSEYYLGIEDSNNVAEIVAFMAGKQLPASVAQDNFIYSVRNDMSRLKQDVAKLRRDNAYFKSMFLAITAIVGLFAGFLAIVDGIGK